MVWSSCGCNPQRFFLSPLTRLSSTSPTSPISRGYPIPSSSSSSWYPTLLSVSQFSFLFSLSFEGIRVAWWGDLFVSSFEFVIRFMILFFSSTWLVMPFDWLINYVLVMRDFERNGWDEITWKRFWLELGEFVIAIHTGFLVSAIKFSSAEVGGLLVSFYCCWAIRMGGPDDALGVQMNSYNILLDGITKLFCPFWL